MADRVRMTCPTCQYTCVPQWLNDEATCLKCFTPLRRRAVGTTGAGVAIGDHERRRPGEASTYKQSPGSAMESMSGSCAKSPTGIHLWRFGKCSHCHAPEPPHGHGPVETPAPAPPRAPPTRPLHDDCARTPATRGDAPPARETPPVVVARNDRTRVECHACGYTCIPQWLNDEAHCLKCQAVLKVQESCHGDLRGRAEVRRQPGEVSTHKASPGDAMTHASGTCAKSPHGQHQWRFGRCDFCEKPEGQLNKGAGVVANPGGKEGECSAGGKCMYRFAKCTKCHKREY